MNVSLTNTVGGASCVALTVAAQGFWLHEIDALSGSQATFFGLLAVVAGGAFLVFSRSIIARSIIVSFAAGGLGMVIGMSRDGLSHHIDHIDHIGYLAMIPTWMTAFMVLCCLPACFLFCRHPAISAAKSVQLHCLAAMTMIPGMLVGSAWLAGLMTKWLSSGLLGHYSAMIVGMCAGTAIGVVVFINFIPAPALSVSRRPGY